jgi:hypothetical protein
MEILHLRRRFGGLTFRRIEPSQTRERSSAIAKGKEKPIDPAIM